MITTVTCLDPIYPKLLREIPDAPSTLYIKGKLPKTKLWLAIVGTRRATPYGLTVTKSICRELAGYDVTIVSGLARGIDAMVHRTILENHGNTVAVLGNGLDIVYPKENKKLYEEIAENGALISEYPLNTPPRPFQFPMRNRIISGLSHGTVVIEAPHKSGAMITARLALDQGREVFAVPGMITSPYAEGPNYLVQEGAKLVMNAKDILEEFGFSQKFLTAETEIAQSLSGEEKNILDLLSEPCTFEELLDETGFDQAVLSRSILSCEIKGFIQSQGSHYYRSQGA